MSTSMPKGAAEAIEIAKSIVKVQGNIFIKELLRQKKRSDNTIRIGVTKEELLTNLIAAIEQRKIGPSELDAWVHDIEGWGKQHVYLYHLSVKLAYDPVWKTAGVFENKLKAAGLGEVWANGTSLDFPEELSLTSVSYSNGAFEVTWHERFDQWNREKERDKDPEIIEGDLYEFRAYRQEVNRSVMRFVVIPSKKKAALFLQIPLADPKHAAARDTARATLQKVFPWDQLKPIMISRTIKSFDMAEMEGYEGGEHGQVQAQNTKFAASGATVEFDADLGNPVWKVVPAVRRVRKALQERAFTGHSGKFVVQLRSGKGMNRDVIMWLHGKAKRVYLHSQMTADEVWIVLDQVLEHSK